MRQYFKKNAKNQLSNVLISLYKKNGSKKIKGKKHPNYVNLVKEALQSNMFNSSRIGVKIAKKTKKNKNLRRKSENRVLSNKIRIVEIDEKSSKYNTKEESEKIIPKAESLTEIKLLAKKRGRKRAKGENTFEIFKNMRNDMEIKKNGSKRRVNSAQKLNTRNILSLSLSDSNEIPEKKEKRAKTRTRTRQLKEKEKFIEINESMTMEPKNNIVLKNGKLSNIMKKGKSNSLKKVTFAEGTIFNNNHNKINNITKRGRKKKKKINREKKENKQEIDINHEVEQTIQKEIQKTERKQLKINEIKQAKIIKRGRKKNEKEENDYVKEIEIIEEDNMGKNNDNKNLNKIMKEHMEKNIKIIKDNINPKLKEYYKKEKKINGEIAITLQNYINNTIENNKSNFSFPIGYENHNIVGSFTLSLNCNKIEELDN